MVSVTAGDELAALKCSDGRSASWRLLLIFVNDALHIRGSVEELLFSIDDLSQRSRQLREPAFGVTLAGRDLGRLRSAVA
jgi:hypothetical protein